LFLSKHFQTLVLKSLEVQYSLKHLLSSKMHNWIITTMKVKHFLGHLLHYSYSQYDCLGFLHKQKTANLLHYYSSIDSILKSQQTLILFYPHLFTTFLGIIIILFIITSSFSIAIATIQYQLLEVRDSLKYYLYWVLLLPFLWILIFGWLL
jgi:hypothetical protein